MKQDRIESNTRRSGGGTAAGSPDSIGQRENLLDALRECYGIASGEERNEQPSESGRNPVAALLRRPLR